MAMYIIMWYTSSPWVIDVLAFRITFGLLIKLNQKETYICRQRGKSHGKTSFRSAIHFSEFSIRYRGVDFCLQDWKFAFFTSLRFVLYQDAAGSSPTGRVLIPASWLAYNYKVLYRQFYFLQICLFFAYLMLVCRKQPNHLLQYTLALLLSDQLCNYSLWL